MRTIRLSLGLLTTLLVMRVFAHDPSPPPPAGRWSFRFDAGGSMPEDADLTLFNGPITQGGEMKLSAGGQFDMALGCRLTPWLILEGELGFTFNEVDSIGDWSYPDSGLSHTAFMVNVVVEKPIGRLIPFAGAGVGGDLSYLSFGGGYDYYWDWEPDGEGSDFVFAYQAFAGLRYDLGGNCSVGVMYRYFATAAQKWDVDWWTGPGFDVGVDAIRVHSVSLVFSMSF